MVDMHGWVWRTFPVGNGDAKPRFGKGAVRVVGRTSGDGIEVVHGMEMNKMSLQEQKGNKETSTNRQQQQLMPAASVVLATANELNEWDKQAIKIWAVGLHMREGCVLVDAGGIQGLNLVVVRTVPSTQVTEFVTVMLQTNLTYQVGGVPFTENIEEQPKFINTHQRELLECMKIHASPPTSVLLFGPPGVGKSSCGQLLKSQLSHELGGKQNVWYYQHAVVDVMDHDENSEMLQQAMNEAVVFAQNTPGKASLIVLDEIDGMQSTLLCTLLDRVAAFRNTNVGSLVMVLASTNCPEQLSTSVRLRFEREICFSLPNIAAKTQLLSLFFPHQDSSQLQHIVQTCCVGYADADMVALARTVMLLEHTHSNLVETIKNAASRMKPAALRLRGFSFSPRQEQVHAIMMDQQQQPMDDEIAGQDEAKRALIMAVEWPLLRSVKLQKFNLTHTFRGVLLYGPPGTGKTSLVRAMAMKLQGTTSFFSLSGADVYSSGVGDAERTIRSVFADARAVAPSIVFFDEIESLVGNRRGTGKIKDVVQSRVLSTFLNEMDGVEECGNVVVLAATNRLDLVDEALQRPGRFDKCVYVGLPAVDAVYRVILRGMGVHLSEDEMKELTARTPIGVLSGADIMGICRRAGLLAVSRRDDGLLTFADLMTVVNEC